MVESVAAGSDVADEEGNGREKTFSTEDLVSNQMFADMVGNVLSSRSELFSRLLDPRRDINDECGYPATAKLTSLNYRDLFDRNPIAARVVEVWPEESWKVQPAVFEDEDMGKTTPFEQAWDEVGMSLFGDESWYQDNEGNPVWEFLKRADIRCGVGSFGVILIGVDDGKELSDPAGFVSGEDVEENRIIVTVDGLSDEPEELDAVEPTETDGLKKLLYLRTFDETQVDIVEWDKDISSSRYGQPVMYSVTIGDPTAEKKDTSTADSPTSTVKVHWSRVVHLADNIGTSELFGTPRMLPVLNRLMDLDKLYSGSAEMYWRGAFPGLSIETHPQLGGRVRIDQTAMRAQMENYQNGLQRWLALMGLSAKSLAPQVVDPTAQIQVQIEAICIKLTIPKRILMGSERGELSSGQDDSTWTERLVARQQLFLTPRVIVPFVNRLILLKVLPEPKQFSVVWPGFEGLSDQEQADVALTETDAMTKYIGGGVDSLIQPLDFLVRILGKSEEEARQIIENTIKFLKEKAEKEAEEEEQMRKREKELRDKGLGPLGPMEKTEEQEGEESGIEEGEEE